MREIFSGQIREEKTKILSVEVSQGFEVGKAHGVCVRAGNTQSKELRHTRYRA